MKRLSTSNREIPQMAMIVNTRLAATTVLPKRSVKRENSNVSGVSSLGRWATGFIPQAMMPAGITRNTSTNATSRPAVIIQPKSITGRILLTTRDTNATMVVSTVYRQGMNMEATVSRTSWIWGQSGWRQCSSR